MARKIVEKPGSGERKMFSIRFDPLHRKALDAAAKREDRTAAYIVRRATIDWLKANGFLK
jgi:predicted DNA-binding protein